MPSIITQTIEQQGFEQVLDRITEILVIELSSQKIKQGFEEEINVFKERIIPIDDSEQMYINILYASSEQSQKGQKDGIYRTSYYIDVFTNGVESEIETGSEDSSGRLVKFLGMIRYILSFTGYNTLLFEDGLIGGTSIESINILDPNERQDSQFSRMGRVLFTVKILENQEMWQGLALQESVTGIKLGTSNKGYKYILND